jgi:hypothetical protein
MTIQTIRGTLPGFTSDVLTAVEGWQNSGWGFFTPATVGATVEVPAGHTAEVLDMDTMRVSARISAGSRITLLTDSGSREGCEMLVAG